MSALLLHERLLAFLFTRYSEDTHCHHITILSILRSLSPHIHPPRFLYRE
jgi:hypothetical protein